jgi:dipeptidyl aminopeptidase/acylaminoacyl peptidase
MTQTEHHVEHRDDDDRPDACPANGWPLMATRITYVLLVGLSFAHSNAYAQDRGFNVRDSIEMTRFSDPSDFEKEARAKFSPDGKHFVVVTSRGLIESNQIESTLWLFDTAQVRSFLQATAPVPEPSPKILAKLAAIPNIAANSIYGSVISAVCWSPDSVKLYFLVQDSNRERHLYEVTTDRGVIQQLTNKGYDVSLFDVTTDAVAYIATGVADNKTVNDKSPGDVINADAHDLTGVPLADILSANADQHSAKVSQIKLVKNGVTHDVGDPWPGSSFSNPTPQFQILSISPSGRFVVRLSPVKTVPASWGLYQPAPGFESFRIRSDGGAAFGEQRLRPRQYVLVDLETGLSIPLVDGPYGDALAYWDGKQVLWSHDERRLLVTETFLSLEGVDPAERSKWVHPCAVADVEISSRTVRCIAFTRDGNSRTVWNPNSLRLQNVRFGTNDNEIVIQFKQRQKKSQTKRYRYIDGAWVSVEVLPGHDPASSPSDSGFPLGSAEPFSVTIKQSLNRPPVLWAEPTSGHGKQLWNPNPQFASMTFGEASVYHWKDKTGYEWTGGLVKPVNYIPGKRYPLVIQTHGFLDYAFITDGIYPTAMAARPLASAGFVVLQTDYRRDHELTFRESEDQIQGFVSAIERLSTDGLIDSKRVGIVGFSRTAYHVESALIKAPQCFTAAIIVDGIDNSYMQYHLWGEQNRGLAVEFEESNGGKPSGKETLYKWIATAPGFQLDRVKAPLRIEAIGGPMSILGEWELYSSLRMQGKPVDLVYIPDGQHVLQKPIDRMASQQGTVDWFRFWLQRYEDSDAAKVIQYRRWRDLRDIQRESHLTTRKR